MRRLIGVYLVALSLLVIPAAAEAAEKNATPQKSGPQRKAKPMIPSTQQPAPFLNVLPQPFQQASRDERPALPQAVVEGHALFERADDAADRQQYGGAAEGYLAAARRFQDLSELDDKVRREWKETLSDARNMAYANALACYVAAGKKAAGIKAVEAAAVTDPEAAVAVRELIKEL